MIARAKTMSKTLVLQVQVTFITLNSTTFRRHVPIHLRQNQINEEENNDKPNASKRTWID